eukprot:PITA_33522
MRKDLKSRGKGQSFGRGRTTNQSEEDSSSRTSRIVEKDNSTRGGRPYKHGRGTGRGRGAAIQCYRCHKWGHKPYECRKGEQARVRGAYVAQTEEAEAPPQEVENVQEKGEALFFNKVLPKPAKEIADQTERKALFQTVCKSHGKRCKLIINSGSTDNLVSIEMVEKLSLKRLKYHTPYKALWLQKGHQLLVYEQCEVEFHIGKYRDKVICDIMPMDVSHILLGRPCQYDRKVVHDGKTKCYKFVKDGIKHTLLPIKEEETTEASGVKALLVGGKEFLKQIKISKIKYVVVRRLKTVLLHTQIADLPKGIQDMLWEFSDIVVDNLQDKVPPKRSISHHTDFIPRASFPNKAAYQMSPKENEEIKK